jgi:hypothetical protein
MFLKRLHGLVTLQNGLRDWSGFVELSPEEKSVGPNRVYELSDHSESWIYDFHWKRPAPKVDAVGCHFLRDVQLWAPSIVVHAGHLIGDGMITDYDNWKSAPALQEDGLFSIPRPIDRIIDRPMLIADGAYSIWGHWIVDYLPRFAIARRLLGSFFDELVVPLPHNVPHWVVALLERICFVRPDNIIQYRPYAERLISDRAVVPSYAYSGEYTLHSFFRRFYRAQLPLISGPRRRICVSRSGPAVAHSNRKFPLRDCFEDMAKDRGYLVVQPETLSISEQIALFADASVVLGEHGSGMHSAVFSDPRTVIACIGFWNAIQLHIGYVCRHRNVYLTRGCIWPSDGQPDFQINVTEPSLVALFDQIDRLS